jgi:hypothetical protein
MLEVLLCIRTYILVFALVQSVQLAVADASTEQMSNLSNSKNGLKGVGKRPRADYSTGEFNPTEGPPSAKRARCIFNVENFKIAELKIVLERLNIGEACDGDRGVEAHHGKLTVKTKI